MKKILLLLAILFLCGTAWAQDTLATSTENENKGFRKEYFKFYLVFPNAIGNNVLKKANKAKGGMGIGVTLYSTENLHFIGLYEHSTYEVTDPSLAANVEHTNLANLGVELLYKIPVVKNLCINPKLLLAYMTVTQRANGTRYGRQEGFGFSPGVDVDYRLTGSFRIFAGVNYSLSFPETHTSEEYKSFFGVLQQVNFQFGVKF